MGNKLEITFHDIKYNFFFFYIHLQYDVVTSHQLCESPPPTYHNMAGYTVMWSLIPIVVLPNIVSRWHYCTTLLLLTLLAVTLSAVIHFTFNVLISANQSGFTDDKPYPSLICDIFV